MMRPESTAARWITSERAAWAALIIFALAVGVRLGAWIAVFALGQ